jgi:hypothetical protein
MKWLWKHRYSLPSIIISLVDSLFLYGAFNCWFWGTRVAPHSELLGRIAKIHLLVNGASIALGVLALISESGSALSKVALVLACLVFYAFGLAG